MKTIKARLTLWYALLLFLTLAGFSAVTHLGVARSVRARFDRSIMTDVYSFAQESEIEEDGELDLETEILTHGERVVAYDPSGQVVATIGLPFKEKVVGLPPLGFDTVLEGSVPWRRLTLNAPTVGLVLQVTRSAEEVERSLSYLFWFLLVGVPTTVLGAGAGGLFLASRLLKPLDKITRTAAGLSASDLSQRLSPLKAEDELSRLVDTFNEMLSRLEDSFGRQKQFTSDAAHELRTPLAVMRVRTEVTLSRDRTPQEYREALEEIQQSLCGISGMVAKLLTLARADAGLLGLELESLDLFEVGRDAVESIRALHPNVEFVLEGNSTPIHGDQTRLTEVVLNLLDNAAKASASSASGLVKVQFGSRDDQALLSISDNGPGVASDHRERIFERFFQSDLARSGDAGTGLGLSISRSIARQHGGDLTLRDAGAPGQPSSGATFDLLLPSPR